QRISAHRDRQGAEARDARTVEPPLFVMTRMQNDRVIHPAVPAERIVPPDRLVGDILRRHAATRPDGLAWVTPSRRWTFAQADAAANRIAQGLASLGIARGDRVACLTRHGAECTLLMVAASRIGAACAP